MGPKLQRAPSEGDMDHAIDSFDRNFRLISHAMTNYGKLGREKRTLPIIRGRMQLLDSYWERAQEASALLERWASDEERRSLDYFTETLLETCEELYLTAFDFFQGEMDSASTSTTSMTAAASGTSSGVSPFQIELPPIQLPTFSGEATKWVSFRDLFTSLIITPPHLSDTQRLHYLLSCVRDEAAKLLSHIRINEANFKVAWDLLLTQYDNNRAVINAHFFELFSIPAVTKEVLPGLRTLRSQFSSATNALKSLGRRVDEWNDILVYYATTKLDKGSLNRWETQLATTTTYPDLDTFLTFLDTRIRGLSACKSQPMTNPSDSKSGTASSSASNKPAKSTNLKNVRALHNSVQNPCVACNQQHRLMQCDKFRSMTVSDRFKLVKQHNFCTNCFARGHAVSKCTSKFTCNSCKRKHHSLLHFEAAAPEATSTPTTVAVASEIPSVTSHAVSLHGHVASVLLATAWVTVHSMHGRRIRVRALIDQGSDATFISESLVQALRLRRQPVRVSVTGIGGRENGNLQSAVSFGVSPSDSASATLSAKAYILPQLTAYTPVRVRWDAAHHSLQGFPLADPDPTSACPIELLLGADLYPQIILEGVRKDPAGSLVAQNSIFGWILSGRMHSESNPQARIHVHHAFALDELIRVIQRFWELDSVPTSSALSVDERRCDDHFSRTHCRLESSRYMVRIPFKSEPPVNIEDSRHIAELSLLRQERRFERDSDLRDSYRSCLAEYEAWGHMYAVPSDKYEPPSYHMPHHAVLKKDSATTKLRVVFNASAPSSNGSSINDHQMIGPKLQANIVSIILRWRLYRITFCADIAQMYRQILVHPADRRYQLILWRRSPAEKITTFELATVTFGTASAPFLAQRVVRQLAADEGERFPLARPILENEIYVDDVMSGGDSLESALEKRNQVRDCLATAHLDLRKWASNDPRLLQDINQSNHGLASDRLFQDDSELKVLGLRWCPKEDHFRVTTHSPPIQSATKRSILSVVARFFDPFGFLAPIIILPKILLQEYWKQNLDWDDLPPDALAGRWSAFISQIPRLEEIVIPRWTRYELTKSTVALHGFSDASSEAYAACVYLVVHTSCTDPISHLVLAKTKVAPLQTISIPRLELCGAHLLAKCMELTIQSLPIAITSVHCWTDSSIVLGWLRKAPSLLKTFVANRISDIQTRLQAHWRHVPTSDNPADCASRGIQPIELRDHLIWWHGPTFLTLEATRWPDQSGFMSFDSPLELKQSKCSALQACTTDSLQLEFRISSWPRLLRVTAYLFRFAQRTRHPDVALRESALQVGEIRHAHNYLLKRDQIEHFANEISSISKGQSLPQSCGLLSLDPFLDSAGILRVGGRLRHSELPSDQQRPILVPPSRIAELLIAQAHKDTLHGGAQVTLRVLRERYWIVGARSKVRSFIHRCGRCIRYAAKIPTQLMSDLPTPRVTKSRPFTHTGVDYAGPIQVRISAGRGHRAHKAYLAIFVCLAVRAVHLELVQDYSSSAFLAAFDRFVARRGYPSAMYSDNGTTFRGAEADLRAAFQQATSDSNTVNLLSTRGIAWHFLPPAAPHFGGLWEAGVKSLKHHLRRVLGNSTPTVEEMLTLLCNIEATLNSRPIAPLRDDIGSYDALTPGHFLVGTALISVPRPATLNLRESRLSRWQQIQQKTEQFWKLWANDYLNTLQQRTKWRSRKPNFEVGDLVILKNPLLPPAQWELARVIECHPDAQGLVRSVRVRTAKSEYTRPINRMCPLLRPADESESL